MNPNSSPERTNPSLLTPPVPFGYKTAWIAIRTQDTNAVAIALDLQNVRSANWEYGIWQAIDSDDHSIFVTPPINGWTLAVGAPILLEADDHAASRAMELSRRFGEAQFFASMRITDAYIWARAINGNLIRLFYEGDSQRREQGEKTEEEKDLRLFDNSSPESNDPEYWKRKDLVFVDEQSVLKIAGKWSVDPSKLQEYGLAPALGLLGLHSENRPPKRQAVRSKKPGWIRRLLGR